VTVYNTPRPGEIAAAFTPHSFDADAYEFSLAALSKGDLILEFRDVVAKQATGDSAGLNCEKARRCARVIARRMS
jgi:hypothetical protein